MFGLPPELLERIAEDQRKVDQKRRLEDYWMDRINRDREAKLKEEQQSYLCKPERALYL